MCLEKMQIVLRTLCTKEVPIVKMIDHWDVMDADVFTAMKVLFVLSVRTSMLCNDVPAKRSIAFVNIPQEALSKYSDWCLASVK